MDIKFLPYINVTFLMMSPVEFSVVERTWENYFFELSGETTKPNVLLRFSWGIQEREVYEAYEGAGEPGDGHIVGYSSPPTPGTIKVLVTFDYPYLGT